ncbi:delta-1-pyrroline-5-carboxylate synthase-like protein [Tanacetum coccineum]
MLLAIPDEHLLKFHGIKDAKTLWEAIKARSGHVCSDDLEENGSQMEVAMFPWRWSKKECTSGISSTSKALVVQDGIWRLLSGALQDEGRAVESLLTRKSRDTGCLLVSLVIVLQGQHIGTLFHIEAHTFIPNGELNAREMAVAARESSRLLRAMPAEESSKILLSIADAHDDGYESSLLSRLALKPGKIASLAIKTGNGLLLKGGKEAKRSNAILHKIITSCITKTAGKGLIGLVTSRDEIPELLKLDDVIDLVIPRGSNALVYQIKSSTQIQGL